MRDKERDGWNMGLRKKGHRERKKDREGKRKKEREILFFFL